ncbi:IS256 family transposase [Gracilibacillus caseinilyticus]|uniref:Mutator family transposase n=2 Tax=Gracilibacillus caseinilyticus TaxID=2932256 RepID=A0ABY4F2K1_9BACI|nr:IS256 family transposase [Gracilibacillus caseinilyticus]UOQ48656.1 IS256 family transposase [Gracilibacillus caseinilyticus]
MFEMGKPKRDPNSVDLANKIIEQYQPETVEDMQNALKDIFGPMFETMLKDEMDHHLGYSSNEKGQKNTENRRNGYGKKTVKTSTGEVELEVPRDRDGSFEPQVIPKRQRDVSAIENKVISMYARGMSQRDISSTIEDIYGFSVSHEMVSNITDHVLTELEEWQTRPLQPCYPFVFVDCLYATIRNDYETKKYAVYTMLGYTMEGKKEILGLWLNETESKHKWMQIFDEIKTRGVEDIFFLSIDGVSGLEEGARAIFPALTVQRCIVHLIRNSLKYVPSKDYKPFTAALRKVYGASSLKACRSAFETFQQQWSSYPGAIDVWKRHFSHVEQLFDYGSAIRKIMYTTNAVESVHSSYRKVTQKGAFPHENALLKVLYLRTKELENKWEGGHIQQWAMVMNQLLIHDHLKDRVLKYLE